jgi:hypothetical protein
MRSIVINKLIFIKDREYQAIESRISFQET